MGFFYDPYICAGIGFAVGIFVGFALRGRSFLFTIETTFPELYKQNKDSQKVIPQALYLVKL